MAEDEFHDERVLEQEEDETALAMEAEHELEQELEHESGGGGESGGSVGASGSSEGAGETSSSEAGVPVVDGSTGEVVGTAHVNPETGMFEVDGVETTTVDESSGSTESQGSSGGESGLATDPEESGAQEQGEPNSGFVPRGTLPPEAFRFRKTGENEQRTPCVPIIFNSNAPGGPVQIKVGVVVIAPLRLRDGRPLTEREAQLDASSAATTTAELLAEALDRGATNPTEVRAAFSKQMDAIMRASGLGYRVQQCFPG